RHQFDIWQARKTRKLIDHRLQALHLTNDRVCAFANYVCRYVRGISRPDVESRRLQTGRDRFGLSQRAFCDALRRKLDRGEGILDLVCHSTCDLPPCRSSLRRDEFREVLTNEYYAAFVRQCMRGQRICESVPVL